MHLVDTKVGSTKYINSGTINQTQNLALVKSPFKFYATYYAMWYNFGGTQVGFPSLNGFDCHNLNFLNIDRYSLTEQSAENSNCNRLRALYLVP